MNILIVSFLKIKMKGWVFVNEVGIYLSLDLRMVYVSQLYVVKMFLNEFLGYEIQYVFNVTGNYFLDLVTVVLRAKCKNVANKMQKIGFKKRHFKRLLNAK